MEVSKVDDSQMQHGQATRDRTATVFAISRCRADENLRLSEIKYPKGIAATKDR